MSWNTSDRRQRLPANWAQLRKSVFARDGHTCTHTINGARCPNRATDVDHIRPGDDHSMTNLRALCSQHHAVKSSQEGNAAYRRAIARNRKKFTHSEPHPGAL